MAINLFSGLGVRMRRTTCAWNYINPKFLPVGKLTSPHTKVLAAQLTELTSFNLMISCPPFVLSINLTDGQFLNIAP